MIYNGQDRLLLHLLRSGQCSLDNDQRITLSVGCGLEGVASVRTAIMDYCSDRRKHLEVMHSIRQERNDDQGRIRVRVKIAERRNSTRFRFDAYFFTVTYIDSYRLGYKNFTLVSEVIKPLFPIVGQILNTPQACGTL